MCRRVLQCRKERAAKPQRGDVGIAPYAETGSLSRGDRRGRPYSPVYIPVSIGRGDHTHRRTLPEVKVQQSKMLHFFVCAFVLVVSHVKQLLVDTSLHFNIIGQLVIIQVLIFPLFKFFGKISIFSHVA